MVQSSIFDIIKSNQCRGTEPVPMPVTYKSTTKTLVGKKVVISWHDVDGVHGETEIIATIDSLNYTYPDTAYNMTWTKQDNPGHYFSTEKNGAGRPYIPDDCAGMSSNIHYSSIKRILN